MQDQLQKLDCNKLDCKNSIAKKLDNAKLNGKKSIAKTRLQKLDCNNSTAKNSIAKTQVQKNSIAKNSIMKQDRLQKLDNKFKNRCDCSRSIFVHNKPPYNKPPYGSSKFCILVVQELFYMWCKNYWLALKGSPKNFKQREFVKIRDRPKLGYLTLLGKTTVMDGAFWWWRTSSDPHCCGFFKPFFLSFYTSFGFKGFGFRLA